MQLCLALLDLADPPTGLISTNPPSTPWEQIDQAARMAALEVLAHLIARMLAVQEAREMADE